MPGHTQMEKSGAASSYLSRIGAIALFGMMCLTTLDVIGRYLFNKPVLGAFELTEFLVLILIFSYLAYTQSVDAHVSVELFVGRLPKKIQTLIYLFNHTVSLALMMLVAWKSFEKAMELIETGENSPNLSLPNYPFVFFMTLGCVVMCIEYLRNLLQVFESKKGEKGK